MENLISLALNKNINAYLVKIEDIVVENRVYLKCAYGCRDFGKRLNCPPHCISINEFKEILKEYEKGVILVEKYELTNQEDIMSAWDDIRKESFHKMLDLEKEAFKSGYEFVHLLRPGSCNECIKCEGYCLKPDIRRFSPEAVGINLSKTLRNIEISLDYNNYSVINLIGILLLY